MSVDPLNPIHELDCRSADSLDVQLLWNECSGRVTVAVQDTLLGDSFTVEVLATDRALDVFDHPFAYAMWRGVDMSGVDLEPTLAALLAA